MFPPPRLRLLINDMSMSAQHLEGQELLLGSVRLFKFFPESLNFVFQAFNLFDNGDLHFCHFYKTKKFELYATRAPDATYFPKTRPRKREPRSSEGRCSRLSRQIVYTCWFNQTVMTAPYQL